MLKDGDGVLNERQNSLLKIIVEDYIKTARPVGSKAICELLNCSSATIRNEMAYLEECGLLEKTHTSSGRIPSEKEKPVIETSNVIYKVEKTKDMRITKIKACKVEIVSNEESEQDDEEE